MVYGEGNDAIGTLIVGSCTCRRSSVNAPHRPPEYPGSPGAIIPARRCTLLLHLAHCSHPLPTSCSKSKKVNKSRKSRRGRDRRDFVGCVK